MAKYIGLMTTDMRGKLGGQVASKNRYGTYMRARVAPVQPRTPYQETARALFTAVSQAWRGLGASVIAQWNAVAASYTRSNSLGQKSNLTGAQLYNKLSINQTNIDPSGGVVSASPVAPVSVAACGIASGTATPTTLVVVGNEAAVPAATTLFIYATAPVSAGKHFFGKKTYRLIAVEAAATSLTALSIFTAYNARFGAPTVASKIAVKFVPVNTATGWEGTPSTAQIVVT
jgi:hypothetical protein